MIDLVTAAMVGLAALAIICGGCLVGIIATAIIYGRKK